MTSSSFKQLINTEIERQSSELSHEWRWLEDSTTLPADKQAVLAAVVAAAGGRGYFVKADVRPSVLAPYLPKISLQEPIYGEAGEAPVDGMIRLMGTWLELYYGYRTGWKFSDAPVPAVGARQTKAMQLLWQRRKPGRMLAYGHKHDGVDLIIDVLYVPLMDKTGADFVQALVHVDIMPLAQFKAA